MAIDQMNSKPPSVPKPLSESVVVVDVEESAATQPIPDEPYSIFSSRMRVYLTYLLGSIMVLSTLTSTIYAPLIPLLSRHFNVSVQAINITVTVYAIFQAVSPAFFASLADSCGRRPVLIFLISLYAVASLGLAINKRNYGALVALRALQSTGGSVTVPIAYGIVADVAILSERGTMLGPMLSTCNAISTVGPIIGGVVATTTGGVTWIFLALLSLAVLFLIFAGFSLPETARIIVGNGSKPAHGVWRTWSSVSSQIWTDKRRMGHKEENGQAATTYENKHTPWRPLSAFASLRMILYLDAAAVLWMVSTSYSVYYTFQAAIPVIFEEIYGYNELKISLALLPLLCGLTVGGMLAGKLMDRNYAKTARKTNTDMSEMKRENLRNFPIESARFKYCLPILLLEVALIAGYGWAVQYRVHPAVPLILHFLICGTSTMLTHTASALLVDIFPDASSTAYASGQMMRCGLSAASVAVLEPLVEALGRGWYFTAFGLFVGVSGLISVFTSRSKGMQWRQKRQNIG